MECQCPSPGYCPRYKKSQQERHWLICREEVLTKSQCEVYKSNWEKLALTACTYLGQEIRTVPCTSCAGHIELKVFSCQLHKETTLRKKVDGIACCLGCKDFSSTP